MAVGRHDMYMMVLQPSLKNGTTTGPAGFGLVLAVSLRQICCDWENFKHVWLPYSVLGFCYNFPLVVGEQSLTFDSSHLHPAPCTRGLFNLTPDPEPNA